MGACTCESTSEIGEVYTGPSRLKIEDVNNLEQVKKALKKFDYGKEIVHEDLKDIVVIDDPEEVILDEASGVKYKG